MKLSEAIKWGATLRGEHHQEQARLVWVGDELRSDAWGAACEAVQPAVAKFNWRDLAVIERSMDAVRAVQQHYFRRYWEMPARCPGSQQRFTEAGGRVINRQGEIKLEGERMGDLGGVTSECDRVEQMAGMVDHLFYAHGWTREQVQEIVEWYEETKSLGALMRNFHHHSPNAHKYVRTLLTKSNAVH